MRSYKSSTIQKWKRQNFVYTFIQPQKPPTQALIFIHFDIKCKTKNFLKLSLSRKHKNLKKSRTLWDEKRKTSGPPVVSCCQNEGCCMNIYYSCCYCCWFLLYSSTSLSISPDTKTMWINKTLNIFVVYRAICEM